MKKYIAITAICLSSLGVAAQSREAQQLLLNWEKLTQFKTILQNMYDGWKAINRGYTSIKEISAGNFSLHKGFLDGLLQVSPAVRSYKHIADIIRYQSLIVKQCKQALDRFKQDAGFSSAEIRYIGSVYANLLDESSKNLEELLLVVTAGNLRMSDDERLETIDRIHQRIEDQFSFMQDFTSSTSYLSLQRKIDAAEIQLSRRLNRN
jgi:hypothetical protein